MPALSTLQYNGVNLLYGKILSFKVRKTNSDDGVRGLYNHIYLSVSCVISPVATQAFPYAKPTPFDHRTQRAGSHPATVFADLRRLLMVERKKLYVWSGTRLILESPQRWADGREAEMDANNGPQPVDFTLDEVMGDGAIFATFTIQTWLAEACLGSPGNPPPVLLSNQFEQSSSVRFPEFLEERQTSGRAVFRTDFLRAMTLPRGPLAARIFGPGVDRPAPGDFKQWVVPPPPDGYQREVEDITETSDGTAIQYSLRDVEVEARWGLRPGTPIVRCEGKQTVAQDTALFWTRSMVHSFHFDVWGYPWATNNHLVSCLILLLQTVRNRNGGTTTSDPPSIRTSDELLAGGIPGNLRGDRRQSLTDSRIDINFPKRHASLNISQKLTGWAANAAGFLGAFPICSPQFFIEDFGDFFGTAAPGAPGVPFPPRAAGGGYLSTPSPQPPPGADPAGPYGVVTTQNPLVGIMHQLLTGACETPPATPQAPRRNARINP